MAIDLDTVAFVLLLAAYLGALAVVPRDEHHCGRGSASRDARVRHLLQFGE